MTAGLFAFGFLAQAGSSLSDTPLAGYGSLGVVAAIACYMIFKYNPARDKARDEAIAKKDEDLLAFLAAKDSALAAKDSAHEANELAQRNAYFESLAKLQERDDARETQRTREALRITEIMQKMSERPCLVEKDGK